MQENELWVMQLQDHKLWKVGQYSKEVLKNAFLVILFPIYLVGDRTLEQMKLWSEKCFITAFVHI